MLLKEGQTFVLVLMLVCLIKLCSNSQYQNIAMASEVPRCSVLYIHRWTICARVTRRSDVRNYSNARGEGKLFSIDLLDQSGEIRATLFNQEADKFMDLIEVCIFIELCNS